MGADCCGGGPPPSSAESNDANVGVNEAAAGVGALSVDGGAAAKSPPNKKASSAEAAPPAKPHSEYVADLQAFLAKRIELFEQYRKRDVDKVRLSRGEKRRRENRVSFFFFD